MRQYEMNEETLNKELEQTQGIIRMLDQFGLDAEQQIRILGFPEGTKTKVLRQHRENKPFPDDQKFSNVSPCWPILVMR